MTIYISILLMMFLINYSGYKNEVMYDTATALFKSLFYQFLVLQLLVLWIWASFSSGSAIKEEVFEKTYDFFRMLPINARTKAAGILIGKNLIALLLAALNFVLITAFGIAGGLSPMLLFQVILIIVSVAILSNSVALLSSINTKGKKRKSEIIGFVLLAFFLGPVIINGIIAMARFKDIETRQGWFFEFKIPVLILASLVVLYFSCWSVKGLLRKFTYEDKPLFNRPGAILFLLGFELVAFGLFYHYLKGIPQGLFAADLNYGYWLVSLSPVLLIPLTSIRTRDRYFEYVGFLTAGSGRQLNPLRLIFYSNIWLWLGLFLIWMVFAIISTCISNQSLGENLIIISVIFSFYVFALLLLELNVVVSPSAPKIAILLAFVLGVYIILPLILAGVLDIEGFYPHSPFGYMICIVDNKQRELLTDIRVAAVNLLLCIVPVSVVIGQYISIINARQQMRGTSL
jgi:hypothetical protein